MPDLDPLIALAGLLVGFTVGLTGMGGGAVMTPVLVLVFGVQPLTAVSSDLVVSLFMKPVGGAVHMRRGTVNKEIVTWLVAGSVPSAFAGVLVLRALGDGEQVQSVVKTALGAALLIATSAIVVRTYLSLRQRARERDDAAAGRPVRGLGPLRVRRVPTVLVGVLGCLVVGMTSVGSGSLIIVMLLILYPMLTASEVVGTDLVQAVPLVAAAALGHLLFGSVELALTASLLIGALPGVYAGARVSSKAPQSFLRRVLAVVLVASGLRLVGLSSEATLVVVVAGMVLGAIAWAAVRRAHGYPWSVRTERREADNRLFFESMASDAAGPDQP